MRSLDSIRKPVSMELLIAFTDLRGFLRVSKELGSSARLFAFLDELALAMAEVVARSDGRIVKFIGDAALVVYPGESTDAGVRNLIDLKLAVDAFVSSRGFASSVRVSAHLGEAMVGPFGPERRLDVIGESVNGAALLQRGSHHAEFAISPEAFRRLSTGTRRLFRRFAPPAVYVAR